MVSSGSPRGRPRLVAALPPRIGPGAGPGALPQGRGARWLICRTADAEGRAPVYRRVVDPAGALRTTAARLGTSSADLLLAVGVTAIGLADVNSGTTEHPALALLLAGPALLSLAWRRAAPVPVLLAVCAVQPLPAPRLPPGSTRRS